MKRFIMYTLATVIFCCSSIFAAHSPIDKGSKLIGTSAYVMYQAGDLYEVNSKPQLTVSIAPSFMFFTSEGFYIGPDIYFYVNSNDTYESSQVGIGPRVGFILNKSAIENGNKNYSLYYFSLFTMISRLNTSQLVYDYYYGDYYPRQYTRHTQSTNLSFGIQIGTYNMISSHFALDYNLRLFVDKNNVHNSSRDETGYTVMFGLGLAGFSF